MRLTLKNMEKKRGGKEKEENIQQSFVVKYHFSSVEKAKKRENLTMKVFKR